MNGDGARSFRRLRQPVLLLYAALALLFVSLAATMAASLRGGWIAALHPSCGLVSALVFFPAFAGALRRVLPRQRNIANIYKTSVS